MPKEQQLICWSEYDLEQRPTDYVQLCTIELRYVNFMAEQLASWPPFY